MAGKSPVRATPEQVRLLEAKAAGADRAEADRARCILLTLRGWTSSRLAEAFGVREDTVRLGRSQLMNGGVEALETKPLPGPEPVKTQAALRVAEPLLSAPATNRINWTLARLADEIAARERVTISKSQLSKALRKKILCGWTAARLGRLSFHTGMEATDAVRHLRDLCRGHRPRE